jgi:hypothetical protein
MPHVIFLLKEDWEENLSNTIVNSKAHGEEEYARNSLQQQHKNFPPLQVEWTLGSEVLAT